ncbi:hypothetical protein [Streptomyces solicathayae]|uniref:Secreted protein n=1 Tax=Streptomyces solicathayae TaxID=3081768 RepID=A0ABZ0M2H7_9ACTN|nr:hypothetical protein [Streptomyces sp. HUAS YS2]WOX25830.1 hypothetical protein R2D22_32405 [Streptomyces sp. HUAS YS2]
MASSSQAAWSSTLRVSAVAVTRPVATSSTESRRPRVESPSMGALNAILVPSGDSEGHSTRSRTVRTVRAAKSPRTR